MDGNSCANPRCPDRPSGTRTGSCVRWRARPTNQAWITPCGRCRRRRRRSSSPPRSARCSSGTTSTSTARSPPSSAPSSSRQFDETTRNIFALLAFAAGFLVRPFGALVFGRLGDLVGRKYTFLVTILIMGLSTFLVGLLPTADQIGVAGAGDPDRAAPAAGPGARRRIRRRGDLRRRACAARQARLLHQLDPDHGDARPVPVAARDPGHPHLAGRGGLRRLGLARSVPGLDRPAGDLGLDPPAAAGVARPSSR